MTHRLNDFQRKFGNYGPVDFAAGSVFGARWWYWWQSYTDRSHLRGVMAGWGPGVNEAACLSARSVMWNGLQVMPSLGNGRPDALRSLFPGVTWPEPVPPHPVPHEDCTCGFYAFWNPAGQIDNALPDSVDTVRVFGVVEGFGVTLEGDLGFRSQKARIVAAYVEPVTACGQAYEDEWSRYDGLPGMVPPRRDLVAAGVAALYRVPVYASREELLANHPPSRPPLERS